MPKRALAPLVLGLLSFACQLDDRVELLRVVRVDPGSVSAGDRVTVWGEGFPEGRPATVVLQGDVHRPGAPPERDVRFTMKATPGPRGAVVFEVDRDLERRLTGVGGAAVHATFRGDARVVFEPTARGVSSITGTLRGVALDVLPASVDPETAAQRARSGAKTLAFVGAAAVSEPGTPGLRLASLDPEGRLRTAGLGAGDRILEFDGVTVMTTSDLRAAPGERTARVLVERNGRPLPPVSVDVRGLAPPGAASLVGAGSLVLFFCALLALGSTPFSFVGSWFLRLATLRRTASPKRPSRPAERGRWWELDFGADVGPATALAASLSFALTGAAFASEALGRPILAREIDLIVGMLVASVALLVTRFFDGGFSPGRGWSLGGAFAASGATLACSFPALVSVAGVVFSTGRSVMEEIVADQGGVPWRWAAARNPGLSLLFFVLVASAVPESAYRGVVPAEGLAPRALPRSTSRSLVRLGEWTYLFMVGGIATALFLGGFRVPGVAYMVQETSRRLQVLGAALFFLKFGFVVGAVLVVRRVAARVFLEDMWGVFARWATVVSLPAACLAVGWAVGLDGARSQVPGDVVGSAMVALASLAVALAIAVRWRRKDSRFSVSTVNPWL